MEMDEVFDDTSADIPKSCLIQDCNFSASSKQSFFSNENLESSDTHRSISSSVMQDKSPRSSMDQALKSEKAFVEYVMSLPSVSRSSRDVPYFPKLEAVPSIRSKPKSCRFIAATTNATKVGLDHLDNLCKLMEQLSELRETNTKLQRRVQYLEDLKTLHEMHKEIRRDVQYGSENVLSQRRQQMFLKKSLTSTDYVTNSPRGSEDYARRSPRGSTDYYFQDPSAIRNCRSSYGRRSRVAESCQYDGQRRERSKSVGHEEVYDNKSKRIFPKWSKVKEALGWESEKKDAIKVSKFANKMSSVKTVSEEPYFQENRRILTDNDIATLRIPIYSEYCEKDYAFPTDSYAGEAMATCGEVCNTQYNSSAEDITGLLEGFYVGQRNSKRDSTSSDKRLSHLDSPIQKFMQYKSTPSPGSDRVKATQDILELQPKSLTIERDIDPEQAFAKFEKEDSKKSHKSPWGRVKTIIEKRRDSLKRRTMRRAPEPVSIASRSQDMAHIIDDVEDEAEPTFGYSFRRKSSDDQFVSNPHLSKAVSNQPVEPPDKVYKKKNQTTADPRQDGGRLRREPPPPLEIDPSNRHDPFERKISVHNSDREVGFRTPGTSPQFHRKSTWMKMKNALRSKKEGQGPSSQSMPSSPNGTRDSHFDFEDTENLEETAEDLDFYGNGHEITRVGSDSYVHKLSTSAPVSDIMLELQRNISEDFTRKMQEWEHIRNSGIRPSTSPKWERKNSGSKSRKKNEKLKTERFDKSPKPKVKDLTWLEKELQKIEKEKQRLSREKEKYEERAIRLERLRQTVLAAQNSNKKEVLVRTSAGEFRFEGISDAFTKKLYEWETKRGLGPELSTIALLDSSFGSNKNITIQQVDKTFNLHHGLSRSESSVAEIGQHSHTSSNSLPSLKPVECGELERIHQHSRANSEPDLSSFANKPSSIQNRLPNPNNLVIKHSDEKVIKDLRSSYVHPEVTQLIDSDVDDAVCDDDSRQEQRDENYYSLLEENVILLEQLKNKEEICKRLENELELLDEKVEDMNKDLEKHREKLWEMHKPGNTPREVQGYLQVMVDLRLRIENLEKCSEKLKTEKETLESSFRFHSAEQEHMTLDLLDKMRELQAAGSEPQKERKICNNKEIPQSSFDIKIVERLQDLSSQLVKQTHELEHALAERTKQICQLRWELLHRDVSTVKLETELHSAQMQGNNTQNRSKCEEKRSKYAHFRSWSSEEASKRAPRECKVADHFRPSELQDTYYKQPEIDFHASKLTDTVHELNKELIRLSSAAEPLLGDQGSEYGEQEEAAKKENVVDPKVQQQENDVHDFVIPSSSEASSCDTTLIQKNEIRLSKISVRRNSAGSISMASGIDPSESSSITEDSVKHFPISKPFPKLHKKVESSTSSSDSECKTEECFVRSIFSPRSLSTAGQEMILQQSSIKKVKKTSCEQTQNHEENFSFEKENKYVLQGLKKKMNNKGVKTTRRLNKRSGQFVLPAYCSHADESNHKCHVFTQSESDTAINNRFLMYNTTEDVDEQENSQTNKKNLRLCKSADHVSKKNFTIQRQNYVTKNPELAKENFLPMCQNSTERETEHYVNQKPHYQSKIRKSESLISPISKALEMRTAKRSKSMKTCKEDKMLCKLQDNNKTRPLSFRKKSRLDKTKEISANYSASQSPTCDKKIIHNITPSITKLCQEQDSFASHTEDKNQPQDEDLLKTSMKINLKVKNAKQKPICMTEKASKERDSSTFTVQLSKRKSNNSNINKINSANQEKGVQAELPQKTSNEISTFTPKCFSVSIISPKNNLIKDYSTENLNQNHCSTKLLEANNKDIPCSMMSSTTIVNKKNLQISEEFSNEINFNDHKISIDTRKKEHSESPSDFFSVKAQGTKSDQKQNYSKSPSAPQLDWIKNCTRKVSREGAPNVKTLIEKYNQKVLEVQSPKRMYSSAYNSPATPRKISAPPGTNISLTKSIPYTFSSTPNSPRITSANYNPLAFKFKPANLNIFHSPTTSPPTSPSSKARSAALQKAKEIFISSTNIAPYVVENQVVDKTITDEPHKLQKFSVQLLPSTSCMPTQTELLCNTTKKSATDSNIPTQLRAKQLSNYSEINDNRKSICSNKSIDSISFVMYKTGETCQESRLLKRNEKQKLSAIQSKFEDTTTKPSKSLSNSSIFRTVKSPDIKFPSSFFRLRRSNRKKDMATVGQLCRQSLVVSGESLLFQEESVTAKSPRSCPSSPELKPKTKAKASWLQRNIFWHK